MPRYTSITILYNPKSTGSSKTLAKQLRKDLRAALPKQAVHMTPTKKHGHGESLAYKLSKASSHPLIISASGDGGYHEVVNGAMRAQAEGAHPTTGVLPAGNANDHYHAVHDHDVVQAIKAGEAKQIDLLQLQYGDRTEYAHSYIGLGMTARSGHMLNVHRARRNQLIDIWLIAKVILFSGPVELYVEGKRRRYDSIIFSNIGKMSKILSLSEVAHPADGKFEVTTARHRSKLWFILHLAKASTMGLHGKRQISEFNFTTTRRTLVQLDGEIITLPSNTTATLTIASKALRCIV